MAIRPICRPCKVRVGCGRQPTPSFFVWFVVKKVFFMRNHRLKRKIRRRFTDILQRSSYIPFYGTLGLLFLFSLFYAGGGHWWLPSVLACTFLLLGLWLLGFWWRTDSRLNIRFHAGLLLFLLPLFAGLIQLLPMGGLVRRLSPVAWQSWISFHELGFAAVPARLTMAPDATWFKCELLLLCLLVFFLLYNFSRRRRNLMLIMATVTAAALGNALIAYWQFFASQSGAGLRSVFTGNFANRNHFGFMMSLGILAALGLLSCIKKDADRRMPHQPAWLKLRIPLIFTVFLLVIAQVLSLSRGAFLSSSVMICAYVTLWWLSSHTSSEGRKIVSALFIVLLSALLFSLQTGLSMLFERYKVLLEQDVFDTDSRISLWKDTITMAKDFPLTGAGLGAYRDTFQRYESSKMVTALADHAHNDWLELLAEIGWPLTMILIAGLFFLLITSARRLWRQQDSTLRWLGFAAMAAILAAMIHECFDFNMQAMSNAILVSALFAVLCSCARNKPANRIDSPAVQPESGMLHPRRLAFLVPAAFILIALLPQQIRRVKAAVINDRLRKNLETPESFRQPRRNDYLRWMQWADQALAITPNAGRIHFRKAVCALRLAELEPDSAAPHWRTAMAESAAACQRFPNKGELLLDSAEIHEAGALHLGLPLQKQVLALYQRAYACHPHLIPTILRVADAYRRLYWQMLADSKLAEKAEALREEALSLFTDFLQLAPRRADEVFEQLVELSDNDQELLDLAAKNLLLQQKLLEYLSQRQLYEMAFRLLEDNKSDWLERPESETSPETARDWYEWKYTLLGLTRQWDLRRQLLPEFQALSLRCLENQIPPIPVDTDAALLQQGDLTFATLTRQPPRSLQVLLRHAEWLAHFGRHSEICTILLPLTYALAPQPIEYLDEAFKLIDLSSGHDAGSIDERERFLRVALAVSIAEQSSGQVPAESAAWLQTLRDLEDPSMPDTRRDSWLQKHLYPLYQGRIYFLRNGFAEASAAYQRSLHLSPQNLLVWTHWQKLPTPFRPAEKPDWAAAIEQGMPLNFHFSNAFALQTVRISQPVVQGFHEIADIEFFWVCSGDILEDCRVKISFHNSAGTLFGDAFSFIELHHPMINWKVGEVFSCKRTYQPLLKTIQGGKPVNDSTLIAAIHLESMFKNATRVYPGTPKAVFPALTMKRPRTDTD